MSLNFNIRRGIAPTNGLEGEYKFANNLLDTSGNNRTLDIVNNVAYDKDSWNRPNEAFAGDAANLRRAGRDEDWSTILGNEFTLSCWVKLKTGSGDNGMIAAFTSVGLGTIINKIHLLKTNDTFTFAIRDNNGVQVDIQTSPQPINVYLNVTAVKSASYIYLYVNNKLIGKADVSLVSVPILHRLTVGAEWVDVNNNYNTNTYLNADVEILRIYNRALNRSEISNLHYEIDETEQLTLLERGEILKLRGSGVGLTKWIDDSGNEFDATNYGVTLDKGRYGQDDYAYNFAPPTAYLDTPNLGSQIKCFSFWAYFNSDITSATSGQIILGQQTITDNYIGIGSLAGLATNETLILTSNITTQRHTYITETLKSSWHHIMFNWNASNNRYDIYINGKLREVLAGSNGHAEIIQADAFFIGKNNLNQRYFSHKITDLEMWDKQLTNEEIRAVVWRIPEN